MQTIRACLLIGIGSILTLSFLAWQRHQVGAATDDEASVRCPHKSTVYDFGAIGDGQTDDTLALQRAVDSKIGEIRFPRGVFRITKSIRVDLDSIGPVALVANGTAKIVMDGPGPAFIFEGTHRGTASPKTVKPNVWQRQRTPLIDGIEIEGKHPDASGILARGTMQAVITRVTVRSARHGIILTGRNRNCIISQCHLYDNHGVGLLLDQLNLHQVNITNCHISYNDQGGIVVRNSEIRNLQIGSCDIEANTSEESKSTANILIDTRNGTVREGAIVGCTIQHSHEPPGTANIRFIGKSREEPQKAGNFCIADNVLSDVGVNIELKHARGVTITGNTFWKAFQHDLLVNGSSNIVVGHNLFDRNPDYRPHDSPNGLLFVDSVDCTINAVHVNGTRDRTAGIILDRCRWFNLTACTILDCGNCGLLLRDCENCRVSDCMIRGKQVGDRRGRAIQVEGGKSNLLVDNLFGGEIRIDADAAESQGNRTK